MHTDAHLLRNDVDLAARCCDDRQLAAVGDAAHCAQAARARQRRSVAHAGAVGAVPWVRHLWRAGSAPCKAECRAPHGEAQKRGRVQRSAAHRRNGASRPRPPARGRPSMPTQRMPAAHTPATRTPSCGSDAMARGWAREVCALLPGAPAVGLRPPGLKLHLQRGHRLLLGPRGWRWERADRCQAIFSCLCAPEASLLAGRLPAA